MISIDIFLIFIFCIFHFNIILKEFYKNVRPWGFWKPIHDKLALENPNFKKNNDFGRDMLNVFVGIIAQTALVILPMYVIFRQSTPVYISIAVLVICLFLLKKFWWNTLDEKLDELKINEDEK